MNRLWCLLGLHQPDKWQLLVSTKVYWKDNKAEGAPMRTEHTYTAIFKCCGSLIAKVINT